MPPKRTVRTPTVHVVLDTNALFTEFVDKLVRDDLSVFISEGVKGLGLDISWHLPVMAKAERKNQMLTKGLALLIPLGKLETLLGHRLGMNESVLEMRVDDAIKRQMTSLGLAELVLDSAVVDWAALMDRAARKQPPFAPEGEKGFKDAIVMESFLQLAKAKPRSRVSCRIILVTEDALLQAATKSAIAGLGNVDVVGDLAELRTTLNAIAAHLTDEDVQGLVQKASRMFLTPPSNTEGLYFKWGVLAEIKKLEINIGILPDPGFSVVEKGPFVRFAAFEKKEGQKVFLRSVVSRRVEATKNSYKPSISPNNLSENVAAFRPSSTLLTQAREEKSDAASGVLSSIAELFNAEKIVRQGRHNYNINWSVTLSRAGNLIKPTLVSVTYEGFTWDAPSSAS